MKKVSQKNWLVRSSWPLVQMGFLFFKAPCQVLQNKLSMVGLHIPRGLHCMVHITNLAIQTLSHLQMVSKIEGLFQTFNNYFSKSPKRHLEFLKLVEVMETKGPSFLRMWKPIGYSCCPLFDMLWQNTKHC